MEKLTKVRVIIAKNGVYATYWKTIIGYNEFTDEGQSTENDIKIDDCKVIAFNYASGLVNVNLGVKYISENWSNDDVFNYLENLDNGKEY